MKDDRSGLSTTIRLNRYIASTGVASRRAADELISSGKVTVNGRQAELGMLVDPRTDSVKVGGKLISPPALDFLYLLLYKPRGYLCSRSDPSGRPLVNDLLAEYKGRRLFTVGRLDLNSEGLILLTDDGEFAAKVGHPSSGPQKTYEVRVRGVPSDATLAKLTSGITLDGRRAAVKSARLIKARKNSWVEITLKEGRNRQIRRMFEALGHPVVKLRRTSIGPLKAGGLKPGQYMSLTPREVARLTGSGKRGSAKSATGSGRPGKRK